jgi:hypothetical protein
MTNRKKVNVVPGALRTYTVYEQRQPLKREYAGKVYYEAHLLKLGTIDAVSATQALTAAKKRGMTDKPLIWGEETEKMRDIYTRRQERDAERD